MSQVIEIVYIFEKLSGRLEIIPVLAFIRAIFKGTYSW
jgi:Trk-type K+ transport system membrane component